MSPDVVIPIVFPDYLIAVNTPAVSVQPPSFLGENFGTLIRIPATKNKVPELGHAGVLFFKGSSGLSKYYEYGRYDAAALGLTRRVPIPDLSMLNGKPTKSSLAKTLAAISRKSGQRGRILAAYIEVKGQFEKMLAYAKKRVQDNTDPAREPYGLLTNSCVHFMKDVMEEGGVNTPWIIDPRPNSYIEEVRGSFPKLDYSPGQIHVVAP